MGKPYRIQRENNNFFIYEVSTDQRLMKLSTYDDANNYIKILNSGAGFSGNTPSFFTKSGMDIVNNLTYDASDE